MSSPTDPAAGANEGACASSAAPVALLLLFLISGVSALIYQVCWQRLLFQTFGVDIDSVTVIVSTFMLGLGAGALAGGECADRTSRNLLAVFALIELAIAVFGAASPWLIHSVGAATVRAPLAAIALVNFLLLLVPTMLMGATLPILVTHVMRHYRNIGVSIGTLYFANTLGAALGAALTGMLVLYYLGVSATIHVAVALNLMVSTAVWFGLRSRVV